MLCARILQVTTAAAVETKVSNVCSIFGRLMDWVGKQGIQCCVRSLSEATRERGYRRFVGRFFFVRQRFIQFLCRSR